MMGNAPKRENQKKNEAAVKFRDAAVWPDVCHSESLSILIKSVR